MRPVRVYWAHRPEYLGHWGGGADTTVWLQEHHPDVGWIGTEGLELKKHFLRATAVAHVRTMGELAVRHAALLDLFRHHRHLLRAVRRRRRRRRHGPAVLRP